MRRSAALMLAVLSTIALFGAMAPVASAKRPKPTPPPPDLIVEPIKPIVYEIPPPPPAD